jgi:hypothetical protein
VSKQIKKNLSLNTSGELVKAVKKISKSIDAKRNRDSDVSRRLNKASDIRSLGQASVIVLAVEQGLTKEVDLLMLFVGVLLLIFSWVLGDMIERGGS